MNKSFFFLILVVLVVGTSAAPLPMLSSITKTLTHVGNGLHSFGTYLGQRIGIFKPTPTLELNGEAKVHVPQTTGHQAQSHVAPLQNPVPAAEVSKSKVPHVDSTATQKSQQLPLVGDRAGAKDTATSASVLSSHPVQDKITASESTASSGKVKTFAVSRSSSAPPSIDTTSAPASLAADKIATSPSAAPASVTKVQQPAPVNLLASTKGSLSVNENAATQSEASLGPTSPIFEAHGQQFRTVGNKLFLANEQTSIPKNGLIFNDPKSTFKFDNPNVIVDKQTGAVQFVRDSEGNFHKVTVDGNGNVALNSQLSMMDHAKIQSRVLTTPSNLIKGTVYTGAALALGALAKNIILNSYNKDTQDDGSTDFMSQVDSVESGSQADASAGGLVDPSVAAGASGVDTTFAGISTSSTGFDASSVAGSTSGMTSTTSSN